MKPTNISNIIRFEVLVLISKSIKRKCTDKLLAFVSCNIPIFGINIHRKHTKHLHKKVLKSLQS